MNHSVRRRRALAVGATLLTLALMGATGCSVLQGDDGASGTSDHGEAAAALTETDPAPKQYVALGDSFTAAPFVPNVVDAQGCFRSTGNYPALVAAALPGTELIDVSCSGADTTHMTRRQATATGSNVLPQFRALTPETDLVTIGIGGNDFGVFQTMTSTCPSLRPQDPRGAPCRDEMQRGGQDTLLPSIAKIGERLAKVVEGVRERSPEAQILLVNYPRLTPTEGRCEELPLARGDYAYSDTIASELDSVLRDVAAEKDVELVDLWNASEGHDVCSDEPWVNGSLTDFSAALEYHPFAAGQQAAADLVLDALGRS